MMSAIITIVDRTSETSMAFNEFVLYRATHYLDEKQIQDYFQKER